MQNRFAMGGLLAIVSLLAGPPLASAQSKSASITGRVVSSEDGQSIAGVKIAVLSLRRSVGTDSLGRFAFTDLKPGSYRVEATLIGFMPLSAIVTVGAGERKDIEFRTDSEGQLLPTIFVEGESEPQPMSMMTTFERRMAVGHGRFITREDIVQRNPSRIIDMIRFLPGVRSDCRAIVCRILLTRDRKDCPPAIFVDDQETSFQVLDITPPGDVQGIEVYRGPAETPPELNTDTARCGGVIAIWTRRGER